jgi:aspartyl-tRNA(Asn)/glutamyl-tRNA(Gln) amidotransferase subunit A
VTFAALDAFSGPEFLDAQRLRSGLRQAVAHAFGDVDVLALPTVASPAPLASEEEHRGGFLDAHVLDGLCRFAFLGNVSGLPALTAPVGLVTGEQGARLPVGLQFVGDAYDEPTLLAVAATLERLGVTTFEPPAGYDATVKRIVG